MKKGPEWNLGWEHRAQMFSCFSSVIVFYSDSTAAASPQQLVLNDAWPQQARIGDYWWTGWFAKIVSFSSSWACFHSLSSFPWQSNAWAALQMCELSINTSSFQRIKYGKMFRKGLSPYIITRPTFKNGLSSEHLLLGQLLFSSCSLFSNENY